MYRIYIALIMFFLQPFISSLLWEIEAVLHSNDYDALIPNTCL